MGDEIDTATRYRERANNLRSIARDRTASDIRGQLNKLADDYERLATTLENIAASNYARERADMARASNRQPRSFPAETGQLDAGRPSLVGCS